MKDNPDRSAINYKYLRLVLVLVSHRRRGKSQKKERIKNIIGLFITTSDMRGRYSCIELHSDILSIKLHLK